jgi:hypothetical protein
VLKFLTGLSHSVGACDDNFSSGKNTVATKGPAGHMDSTFVSGGFVEGNSDYYSGSTVEGHDISPL